MVGVVTLCHTLVDLLEVNINQLQEPLDMVITHGDQAGNDS